MPVCMNHTAQKRTCRAYKDSQIVEQDQDQFWSNYGKRKLKKRVGSCLTCRYYYTKLKAQGKTSKDFSPFVSPEDLPPGMINLFRRVIEERKERKKRAKTRGVSQ